MPHLHFLPSTNHQTKKIAGEEELKKSYTINLFELHVLFEGLLLRIEPANLDGKT